MFFYAKVRGASRRVQTLAERLRGQNTVEGKEQTTKSKQHGAWRESLDQSTLTGNLMPSIIPKALVPKWNKLKTTGDWKKFLPRQVVQEIVKTCSARKIAVCESFFNNLKQRSASCDPSIFIENSSKTVSSISRKDVRPSIFSSLNTSVCSKIVTPKSSFLKSKSYYHTMSLPEAKWRVPKMKLCEERRSLLISRRLMETASSSVRYSNTMVTTEKQILIRVNTAGFDKANITVEVENGWLIVEALATTSEENGGYLQKHMMRRYEIPSHSDIQNIKVELNEETKELRITIPTLQPKNPFK